MRLVPLLGDTAIDRPALYEERDHLWGIGDLRGGVDREPTRWTQNPIVHDLRTAKHENYTNRPNYSVDPALREQ
jgi:hypothetical protein